MSEERKLSLGEFLKNERERRGLTIEQTSSATKIGLKVLKQLEGDRYSELPALPFVRGFVRNYAKFLGIDGEKLLLDYASFLEEHSRERPKRDAGHSGYAFERPEGEQSRKILWGVMAAMLVFGGAVVFIFKPSLKQKHHGHVNKLRASPTPTATAETAVAETSPSPGPSETVAAVAAPSPSPVAVAESAPTPSPTTPFVPPKTPLVLAASEPKPSPSPSPTRVAAVAPSPSPSPSPQVVAAISPVPSPPAPASTPAASPVAAVAAIDPAEDLKKDPLQSGTNYPPKEIKYKLIFRTKADVWVRYQCDDKKLMKFALKQGKILVLRGKRSIRFQASNPESITIQLAGGPERLLSDSPSMFEYAGNSTVILPTEDREKAGEIFKVGAPLPRTDDPASTETSPSEAL